jgi:hydroxyacylglutathione hydrolase
MEIKPITLNYLFSVNSYLLKTEEGYFLIDTGLTKTRGQLEEELEAAGCHPGDLKLIIITHGHTDHTGNAAYLRDRYGAKVAAHRGDSKMCESGNMFTDVEGGVLFKVIGALTKIIGVGDSDRFTPDIYLEDTQDLSTYGLKATVLHTPGHSEGSISIHTAEGDLFCGDLFNNDKKPEKASLVQDAELLEASVQRIRALEVSTVYPGHGKPFTMDELTE